MRVLDRVLAVVLAALLFVAGALTVLEVAWAAIGKRGQLLAPYETWADYLRTHTWSSGPVVAGCVVVALVGLVLLLEELKPRRPGLLAVHSDDETLTVGLARRSLSRGLATAAADVDGISEASAIIGKRRAAITAVSALRDVTGLQQHVQDQMQAWIDGLNLVSPPRLTVTVKQKEH